MTPRLHGFYATEIYLPCSAFSRALRRWRNRLKGREEKFLQSTRLPVVSWKRVLRPTVIHLLEHAKANGNVRISELGVLCQAAANCADQTNLFEIGTFDGRTTINLARNSPARCRVVTLDLPPDEPTKFDLAKGERHFVEKPRSGARYRAHEQRAPELFAKIQQHLADSAKFDYTPFHGTCSLVFVDGSHAYDYALSDTAAAMKLVRPGGVILWHDYGIWKGVTDALEELEARDHLGLANIAGTSLVFWRKPA